MWKENEIRQLSKVPLVLADDLIKTIRLLAMTGKKLFHQHLFEPIDYAGWELKNSNINSRTLMERINQACEREESVHTAGPLGKRLISVALTENLSAIGDSSIFFLEKMTQFSQIATTREAIEFVKIIFPALKEFGDAHKNKSELLFEESLKNLSQDDFKSAFAPVDLGKQNVKIHVQREAYILFEKIKSANLRDDIARCRKLISAYLIKFADQEDNNRDEVEKLISAFEKKEEGFRRQVQDVMALALYYQIIGGITEGDLKKAIRGIRKYAFIFQGDPDNLYFLEIDNLEKKLYAIIKEKDLWKELKKS